MAAKRLSFYCMYLKCNNEATNLPQTSHMYLAFTHALLTMFANETSWILACNHAGFVNCAIRENIRASLVELWLVFWRDQTNPDISPNRAKTCTITCLPSLTKKFIFENEISWLKKLHSCVNARSHQFPRSGDRSPSKDKFWREFCNECVCRFVFFHADRDFIFAADFQERNQT